MWTVLQPQRACSRRIPPAPAFGRRMTADRRSWRRSTGISGSRPDSRRCTPPTACWRAPQHSTDTAPATRSRKSPSKALCDRRSQTRMGRHKAGSITHECPRSASMRPSRPRSSKASRLAVAGVRVWRMFWSYKAAFQPSSLVPWSKRSAICLLSTAPEAPLR